MLACGAPASAEPPAPADPYGDIMVTAQRRPERAQDVPISLTVLSGEALEASQVIDTANNELQSFFAGKESLDDMLNKIDHAARDAL